jgi:hypothetical protein
MSETVAQRELPRYRREMRERYTRAKGYPPREKQEILMAELAMWIDVVSAHEPDAILRTIPQLVRHGPGRYLGWKTTGTVRGDQALYGNRIKRGLDYLKEIGWVADRSYVQEFTGRGVGILVAPGPCSSTGDAPTPRRRRGGPQRGQECPQERRPHVRNGRRRVRLLRDVLAASSSSSSGELSAPVGASDFPSENPEAVGEAVRACARPLGVTRSRPTVSATDRAALEAWWETARGGEPSGAELLLAVPGLAGVQVVAMARAVFAVVHPSAATTISARQRERLKAAVRRCDRCADMGAGREGAGRELVLDLILGDWREHALERRAEGRQRVATPRYVAPKTLGGIAVCARRVANQWRRGQRRRER